MRTFLAALLLALALPLPGCGGGGGGGGGGGSGSEPDTGFRVLLTSPRDGEYYVDLDKVIEITFTAPVQTPSVTTDSIELSAAEVEAREQVEQFVDWLREKVPGFADAYLSSTASQIGIRESRRVKGLYELTEDDGDIYLLPVILQAIEVLKAP